MGKVMILPSHAARRSLSFTGVVGRTLLNVTFLKGKDFNAQKKQQEKVGPLVPLWYVVVTPK